MIGNRIVLTSIRERMGRNYVFDAPRICTIWLLNLGSVYENLYAATLKFYNWNGGYGSCKSLMIYEPQSDRYQLLMANLKAEIEIDI